tara:strand:- start:675 stop:1130 length:456 start_codon:yes stop_codon:yes gene_type:complete
MDIDIIRYNSKEGFTDGLFFINGEFQVHTLEPEYREVKIYGKKRIPNGKYKLGFRTEGGFHQKYLKKFGAEFHKGMIEIKDVPDFEFVLIHIGNKRKDTLACLLTGMSNNANDIGFIGGSTEAYKKIYPEISKALFSGEEVWISYKNINIF